MFLQSILWIPGALVVFFILRWVGVKIVEVWMPKSSRELAEENLTEEISKLEDLRVKLELSKVQCDLAEDELKLEKAMAKNDIAINNLKDKLSKIKEQKHES